MVDEVTEINQLTDGISRKHKYTLINSIDIVIYISKLHTSTYRYSHNIIHIKSVFLIITLRESGISILLLYIRVRFSVV